MYAGRFFIIIKKLYLYILYCQTSLIVYFMTVSVYNNQHRHTLDPHKTIYNHKNFTNATLHSLKRYITPYTNYAIQLQHFNIFALFMIKCLIEK